MSNNPKLQIEPVWAPMQYIAARYGLTRDKQYRLIAAGEIVASKAGRATLVNVPSVGGHLERNRVQQFPAREEMRRRRLAKAVKRTLLETTP